VADTRSAAEGPAELTVSHDEAVKRDDAPRRERGTRPPRGEKRRERSEQPRAERPETPRMERTERTDRTSDKRERPSRDFKRKDDDLILEPAPDKVKGFGSDIPSFLRKR
jgi:hypothetical protein